MSTYPGGKNGSGVYQTIINQFPPHRVYIEPFLGSGAIMRLKKPAEINIGIDKDPAAVHAWNSDAGLQPGVTVICDDAISWLASNVIPTDALIYLDPPYIMGTRSRQRTLYRCELDDDDHRRLLQIITGLHCSIAISGYWSGMYAEALADWRLVKFQAMTRGGKMATECLWLNYLEPLELHDYRYLGDNFRERERIKRKQARWRNRLARMTAQERYAMLSVLDELRSTTPPGPAMVATPETTIGSHNPENGDARPSLQMAFPDPIVSSVDAIPPP